MTCHGIDRAFGHHEVNCGFRPYVATEPTAIRSKRGTGLLITTVRANEGIALYSVRNPRAIHTPAPRPAVKGCDGHDYVYCYKRAGSLTGWIRKSLVKPDLNAASKPPADGPASEDFEIGRQPCTRNKPSGCGKKSLKRPVMRVIADTVHGRYSPRGTSVHILHTGDEGRVLIANGPHGFHFLEITKAAADGSAKKDMRLWVIATALQRTT